MHYHCAITEPTAMCCLSCDIIFWTTSYNTPRTFCLPATQSYFTIHVNASRQLPQTICIAHKPLTATSRTYALPFLIPIHKLVLYGSQHHLLLFIDLRYPCGRLSQCSFPYTCFIVISTGLISKETLTGLSRLV